MQCRNKYFGPLRLLVFHSVIRMLAWIDIIRFIEAVGMIPNLFSLLTIGIGKSALFKRQTLHLSVTDNHRYVHWQFQYHLIYITPTHYPYTFEFISAIKLAFFKIIKCIHAVFNASLLETRPRHCRSDYLHMLEIFCNLDILFQTY